MNVLLSIAVDRLAEHYHVSSDHLRKALLIRGVTELSAVTDRSKPATPEDLDRVFTIMNGQLHEMLERFRKQAIEIDDAVQQAKVALAVIDRVAAVMAAGVDKSATNIRPL